MVREHHWYFYQIFNEELTPVILELFSNIKDRNLTEFIYDANIILLGKHDKSTLTNSKLKSMKQERYKQCYLLSGHSKKNFQKCQYSFVINFLSKTNIELSHLNIKKAGSNKAKLNTILDAKRMEAFPLKPTRIESCVFNSYSQSKNEKEMKDMNMKETMQIVLV